MEFCTLQPNKLMEVFWLIFFFPMLYVAFHWCHANEVPSKLCQLKIFAMDFCSPFRSWGWRVLPSLCSASDVTAIIQDVFFSTWGKSRETQMCELLIKCLWLNVEVFCGRESISHSAHPNTNHYLAFLIKDCTLVWWQVPPKARTDESTFPLRELPYVLCICVSLLWLAADSFRCSTSPRSLIYAPTVQEGNSISGTAATDRLPISHSCEEKETLFQFSVNPKIQL